MWVLRVLQVLMTCVISGRWIMLWVAKKAKSTFRMLCSILTVRCRFEARRCGRLIRARLLAMM